MSVVFLRSIDGSTLIGLDATESVSYSRTVQVSTSTMFDGSKRSDNVHPNLPRISFQGVISAFKIRNTYPSPKEFRKNLDKLVDSYEVLNFFGTEDDAIPDLSNCYITNYHLERDAGHSNSLIVTITLQQLDITSAVTATKVTKPKTEEVAKNPTKSKNGTTTEKKQPVSSLYVAGSLNAKLAGGY